MCFHEAGVDDDLNDLENREWRLLRIKTFFQYLVERRFFYFFFYFFFWDMKQIKFKVLAL